MSIGIQQFNRPVVARVLAVTALVIALLLQCIGAWTDSQTTDEGAHLGAGLSYWRTGDWRLNPEHPPLVKLLAALPLLGFQQLQPAANPQLWEARDQWSIGRLILYQQLNPRTETQAVLWLARLPMILIWLGLGLVVWRWAEHRSGVWGGAIAATLFAFEPTLLGHGHLITTDVAVSFGLAAIVWIATTLVTRPSWRLAVGFALVFALTQLTKYSALLFWPMMFGLLGLATTHAQTRWTWQWWRRTLGLTLLVSILVTWMVYGFELSAPAADPRIAQLWQERDALIGTPELEQLAYPLQWLIEATAPGSDLRTWLDQASQRLIPAYSYWRGFFAVASHNAVGHVAYLFGEQSSTGWWYYFPVALAVKTPLPIMILVVWLVYSAWGHRASLRRPDHYFLYGAISLYLLWSLTSKINIGIRHLLPIWPLIIVLLGGLTQTIRTRWQRVSFALIVVSLPIVSVAAWPHTIGYFNALAGGTAGGHRIILDSNLDWNQDLWRLRNELAITPVERPMIALFGSVPVEVVHAAPIRVPTDKQVAEQGQPRGVVIISKGILYSVDLPFTWLRDIPPTKRIGSSILWFDFR